MEVWKYISKAKFILVERKYVWRLLDTSKVSHQRHKAAAASCKAEFWSWPGSWSWSWFWTGGLLGFGDPNGKFCLPWHLKSRKMHIQHKNHCLKLWPHCIYSSFYFSFYGRPVELPFVSYFPVWSSSSCGGFYLLMHSTCTSRTSRRTRRQRTKGHMFSVRLLAIYWSKS